MFKYSKPLGADKAYKRPEITYQEQLSKEEIMEKLKGYIKVIDIKEVPINTHLRYFIMGPDGKPVFRTGGLLYNKLNADIYVVLTNGKKSWSVQIKNTVFYKKMSHTEELASMERKYNKKLEEKNETINDLKHKMSPVTIELVKYDKRKDPISDDSDELYTKQSTYKEEKVHISRKKTEKKAK